jgi:hypothetical protein
MRLLLALILICTFPVILEAQKSSTTSLTSQLKKVLAEAPNGFKSLKGKQVKKEEEVNQEGDIAYAV